MHGRRTILGSGTLTDESERDRKKLLFKINLNLSMPDVGGGGGHLVRYALGLKVTSLYKRLLRKCGLKTVGAQSDRSRKKVKRTSAYFPY
jgi:hypothetical protein